MYILKNNVTIWVLSNAFYLKNAKFRIKPILRNFITSSKIINRTNIFYLTTNKYNNIFISLFSTKSLNLKEKNKIDFDKWNNFTYKIPNTIYNPDFKILVEDLNDALLNFHDYILNSNMKKYNYIYCIVRLKTKMNTYISLTYMEKFNLEYFEDFVDIVYHFHSKRTALYDLENISDIIFSYKICSSFSVITEIKLNKHIDTELDKKGESIPDFMIYSGLKLPTTMDLTKWGKIKYQKGNVIIIQKENSDLVYIVYKGIMGEERNNVTLMQDDKVLTNFIDYKNELNLDLGTFKRVILKNTYYFEDSKLVLKEIQHKAYYLKKLLKDKFITEKFLTMDIETRKVEDYTRPYCISIYDGIRNKSFYITDYDNKEKNLCKAAIQYLMREKYNKHKVYLHNFSSFDSTFLITTLSDLSVKILKPIIRHGSIIDFKFYYGKNYYINFRDSLLLLPVSLAELAKSFKIEDKGIFPYKFVNNKHIKLDYNGKFPRYHFFEWDKYYNTKYYLTYKNNYLEYRKKFINKNWNLKEETIKYCELDTIILYKILKEFNKIIFSVFRVEAIKYPTISSLAFAIYRTNYMKIEDIPLIYGNLYKVLKLSYTGGSVDVYKPYGENIYGYDVNSLYPTIMHNMEMPIGKPLYFEGDLSKTDSHNLEKLGFYEVEVTAPLDIKIPLLQKKIKFNNEYRTISPVGTWKGVYFSEEIKEAEKLGYTFKILRGYLFNKANIFKEFVKDLFKFKEESLKGSAYYIIFKLLMNSLYGRFGMRPENENNIIIDTNQFDKFFHEKQRVVVNNISLNNGKELVSFFDLKDLDLYSNKRVNISVPIASAITSYGRIYMNSFKNLKDNTLYYSDTDSVYLDKELDSSLIGTKLGQFKLERIFSKAVFLSSKFYGGRYIDKNNKMKSYVKIRGMKKKIDFFHLLPLLYKNKHIEIAQTKWYREISNERIKIKSNNKHKFKVSCFKRNNIYDSKNKFIDTKPLVLKEGKLL